MHPLHKPQQNHHSEEQVKLTTLNDGILFMEEHFFQLELQFKPQSHFSKQFIFIMRGLALLENKRIKLKKILERTDLIKDTAAAEENWIHFNYQINNLEKELLYNISQGRFTERTLHFIKQNFIMIYGLVKFKFQYYTNQILDQNIICNEILEEDKELDIDLSDQKNYEFRMYLKNSKAGARFKKVFIDSFGFDNINLAHDIFGDGKDKVIEKLKKRFTLKALKVIKEENEKLLKEGHKIANWQVCNLHYYNQEFFNSQKVLANENAPLSNLDSLNINDRNELQISTENNIDNNVISSNELNKSNIESNIESNNESNIESNNESSKNLTKAERKKLQIQEKEKRKVLQLEAFNKKQEIRDLKNQSMNRKPSQEVMDTLDRMKIVLDAQFNKKFPEAKWKLIYSTAAKMEKVFGSILKGEGAKKWVEWIDDMDRPPPV